MDPVNVGTALPIVFGAMTIGKPSESPQLPASNEKLNQH
jgi:hypothetical protein